MDQVIAKLAEVAKEYREGKDLPLHAVAKQTTVGDDAVRKFERGEQGRNIDRMANAYADALGEEVSVFDLWDEALSRARDAQAKLERGIGPTEQAPSDEQLAKEAVGLADDATRATLKAERKSPGRQKPKAKKSRAG